MPSKKRFQRTNGANPNIQVDVDAPWVHEWPGVQVTPSSSPFFNHTRVSASNKTFGTIKTMQNPRKEYKDFIYILLNMRWPQLMLVLSAMYFGIIALFGVFLHYLCGNSESFAYDFNLAYQTYSTIGFGILFPINRCSNYVVTVEGFVSILSLAALTGLMFAKFAKPKGKIAFSDVAVIHPYGKERLALVVRVANATQSHDVSRDVIMDASFTFSLICIEGSRLTHHKLELLQSNIITFRMVLALVHVIDIDSPLYGMTQEALQASDMILQVGMTGVDSTLQDTIMQRKIYSMKMIQWGFRFGEMLHFNDDASVSIFFKDLSTIHSAPIDDSFLTAPPTPPEVPTPDAIKPFMHATLSPTPRMGWASSSKRSSSRRLQLKASEMEPLFEPLLQPDVGTQRIARKSKKTHLKGTPMPQHQWRHLQHQVAGDSDVLEQKNSMDSTASMLWAHTTSQIVHEMDEDVDDIKADISDISSIQSVEIPNTPRYLKIRPMNVPYSYSFQSFYYHFIHLSWPRIIMIIVIGFCVITVAFAGLFCIDYDGVVVNSSIQEVNSNFEVCLYFSVHTIATIGYGVIGPQPDSTKNNFFVTLESSLGLIFTTIFTGIAWSKFARPRAHIHFSKQIIITTIHGQRCLLFRAANTRHHGDIRESSFRIGVNLTNSKTGLRQMQDVPLLIPIWPSTRIPVTLIHVIDENSPFYQFQSPNDFSSYRVSVIALFTGLDTTFTENVYARKMYFWDDFVMDMHFDDCVSICNGSVTIDYSRFDVLLPDTIDVSRVVVFGMTCAGKSTCALHLSKAFDLPLIESDALFWAPQWIPVPKDEYVKNVDIATAENAWVMAGCSKAARELVLQRATIVLWLDFSLWLLFKRLCVRTFNRWWYQELLWGTNTESMWQHFQFWSEESLFHHLFLRYWQRKTEFPLLFAKYPHLKIHRFHTPEQLEIYLSSLSTQERE
ncbi:inward rectifier K channel (IRK-C) family protein [Thraustotheca clavata]|uniref:Inward rectifier K channel (IRK-C) family protein n=1 Tax=Thraustotheca clavata TaxID=74557 RepID=A0A1V9Y454_9STRA|nr:inward rectifier K channel (IRK-C) family protein [Thraustotheca clavata]